MKKQKYLFLLTIAAASFLFSGCSIFGGKKEEGPVDVQLTSIGLEDLKQERFYVKSASGFYELPVERGSFTTEDELKDTNGGLNGIISEKQQDRMLYFTWKDNAIPTIYKNEQLIYVGSTITDFTWERFKDLGYSVGAYNLVLPDSDKISFVKGTSHAAETSSLETGILNSGLTEITTLTFDKINGATMSGDYYGEGGIVTGFSKDAGASVLMYSGTTPLEIEASADTRFFKTFEVYKTNGYSLSTDGYAIVTIPDYFKSGFYLINNVGFVRYIDVERGQDESNVDFDTPYYYIDESNGKVITYFEYINKNGGELPQTTTPNQPQKTETPTETYVVNVDSTQAGLNVGIDYKYTSEKTENDAKRNGIFPKMAIVSPLGEYTYFDTNNVRTNENGMYHTELTVDGVIAGEWSINLYNFDNIKKNIVANVISGSSTSYVHTGNKGTIKVFERASASPHECVISWAEKTKAATIKMKDPEGNEYSNEKTPEMYRSEYGSCAIKLPNLLEGEYEIEVSGDSLGRVWVDMNKIEIEAPEEITDEDIEAETVEGETEAQETVEGEEGEGEQESESAEAEETAEAESQSEEAVE